MSFKLNRTENRVLAAVLCSVVAFSSFTFPSLAETTSSTSLPSAGVDFVLAESVYLITVYAKTARETLSAEEKAVLRELVKRLKG